MKKHAGPIFAAVLLLLPVMYLGSYLALVNPPPRAVLSKTRSVYITNYRVDGHWPPYLYWPLEKVDRKLRPKEWNQLGSD
jgi:hypothetical protein